MDRCWLAGSSRGARPAVPWAPSFDIRWMLRAIAVKRLAALLSMFSLLAL